MGGLCRIVPKLSGTLCDNGDPCTVEDFCVPGGICRAGSEQSCAADVGSDAQIEDVHDTDTETADVFDSKDGSSDGSETLSNDVDAETGDSETNDSEKGEPEPITLEGPIVVSDTDHAINSPPVLLPSTEGKTLAYYSAMENAEGSASIRARLLDPQGNPLGPSEEIHFNEGSPLYPSSGAPSLINILTLFDQENQSLKVWTVKDFVKVEERAVLEGVVLDLTNTLGELGTSWLAYNAGAGARVEKILHDGSKVILQELEGNTRIQIAHHENRIYALSKVENDSGKDEMRLFEVSDPERPPLSLEYEGIGAGRSFGITTLGEGDQVRIYAAWSDCGENPTSPLISADLDLQNFQLETELHQICIGDAKNLPLIPMGTHNLLTAWFENDELSLSSFDSQTKNRQTINFGSSLDPTFQQMFISVAPKRLINENLLLWPGIVSSLNTKKIYDASVWKINFSPEAF